MKTFMHIGFPKTGSTWLQNNLFSQNEHFHFLSLHNKNLNRDKDFQQTYKNWAHAVLFQDPLTFQENSSVQRGTEEIYNSIQFNAAKNVIISEEGFSSSAYRVDICHRLKNTFPDSQVIIFIRNQMDMIQSMYLQYARGFGKKTYSCTFEEYVDNFIFKEGMVSYPPDANHESQYIISRSALSHLNYSSLIELYTNTFGHKDVHVFPYEGVFNDDRINFERLLALFGLENEVDKFSLNQKTHSKMSASEYKSSYYKGHKNPFKSIGSATFKAQQKIEAMGIMKKKHLSLNYTESQKHKLKNFYTAGNRQLVEKYNFALEKYGYPV